MANPLLEAKIANYMEVIDVGQNYRIQCGGAKARKQNLITFKPLEKQFEEVLTKGLIPALGTALYVEEDIDYAIHVIGAYAKKVINIEIELQTNADFVWLEEMMQKKKAEYPIIMNYYEVLRLEARFWFDSYCLYIEKYRKRKDRFYEPRRDRLLTITDHLQMLADDKLDELFVHQPPRTGKLLSDDTPVLTSKGWKNHGDLVVGDKVVGSDGKWTKIIAVHPKHHTTHKVRFTNGEVIECHYNHEWTVYDRHAQRVKTVETHEMIGHTENGRFEVRELVNGQMIVIKSVEECEHHSGNCITVANEDGLYAVGKTMLMTHNSGLMTMFNAWWCAKDPELSNLYATYKESLGGAFLDGVMEIWTDPTYAHAEVFPETKIAYTDAKNHKVDLGRKKKYKTLSGKGLESGLNGEYDATGLMTIDDILEGIQDVMNKETLKRKQTVFDNNLMSRKKEKCKVIYNGTIWSLHDIFSDRLEFIQNNPEASHIRVAVVKIPALDPETDESNFDYAYGVGFSTQYYRTLRAKFEENDDLASWMAQYQQEPIERDGAVFTAEHMKYYNGVLPEEEPFRICAACDVALGGLDYLAFAVAYCYENGDVYIDDVIFDNSEKKVTKPKVIDMIIDHNIGSVYFEANQGGEGYKDEVDAELRKRGYKINLRSEYAPTSKRKEQRIWDKAGSIRDFYFRDVGCRSTEYRKFMTNLYSFTMHAKKRDHDDAPDCLASLAYFLEGSWSNAKVEAVKNPFRYGYSGFGYR